MQDGVTRTERQISARTPRSVSQRVNSDGRPRSPLSLSAKASSPSLTFGEIITEFFTNDGIPDAVKRDTAVSIERRWIAEDLPDVEILDALAHAYGVLNLLLEDAHKQAGGETGHVWSDGEHTLVLPKNLLHAGRLPCMVTSTAARTLTLGAFDGRDAGGRVFDAEVPDRKSAEKALQRYKSPRIKLQSYPMDAVDWSELYLANAMAILRSGEEHGWFMLYFRRRSKVHVQALYARDRADKRSLSKEVAHFVAVNSIDGVISIGEVWSSAFERDADGVPVNPAEQPDRTEALHRHAETASGKMRDIIVPFRRRRFGRPIIDEPVEDNAEFMFLGPVRAVWRLMRPPADPSSEPAETGAPTGEPVEAEDQEIQQT